MKVSAAFVTSAIAPDGFPKERLPELALAGRSNVGKSSLINALVRQKIARTSAAPGKTRLANFYRVASEGQPPFHFVDLPGYGYARGGQASAREFQAIASAYFGARQRGVDARPGGRAARRRSLAVGVLLLVDSRHPGLESDLLAWEWLGTTGLPRQVVATKLDKLSRADRTRHFAELDRLYHGPVLGVSVQTGEGLKELWELIATLLRPSRLEKPAPPPPSQSHSI